jgi:hypothetical protein
MKPVSVFTLTLLAAVPALAQYYVSINGSDSNSCNSTTPCRTFARAIAATNYSGDVIYALDAGLYPGFVITKPIVIDGNGGAEIIPSTFSGLTPAVCTTMAGNSTDGSTPFSISLK